MTIPVRWFIPLTVLGLLSWSVPSQAETFTAKFDNVQPGKTVTVTHNSSTFSTSAGVFNWSQGTHPEIGATFESFCVELNQHVTAGQTVTYEVRSLEDMPTIGTKADLVRELFGVYHSQVINKNTAAAFQIALWEILHDTGYNLSGGSFQVSAPAAVITIAQGWLDWLKVNNGPLATGLVGVFNSKYQDHITIVPTPVPPSLLLMGLGGFGLLAARFRRRA